MYNFKIIHPLQSVILVFCAAHAFDIGLGLSGVTSDSSVSHLSQDVGLGLGQYQDSSSKEGRSLGTETKRETRPSDLSEALKTSRPSPSSEENHVTASVGLGLAIDKVQNHTSELNDLFAVGSDNESTALNSKVKLIGLVDVSSAKTNQMKPHIPIAFNRSLNESKTGPMARPMASVNLGLQQANTNKPLIVPSEGGVLEESISRTSTSKSGSLEVNTQTAKTEVKDGKGGLGLGIPTREGVSSLVKQSKSQDSHVSARKGANLSEETESANSKVGSTMGPLMFTSSDTGIVSLGPHPQKITPRKGAEPPKIFPRKGVDEQFINSNSSELFLSDTNSNNKSNETPLAVSVMPTISPTYGSGPTDSTNSMDIVKHINTSKAARPTLQNSSKPLTYATEKTITQSVNSESSVTGTSNNTRPMADGTTKTKPLIDVTASKNNLSSMVEINNSTLDKSGIFASYPPLKKRPKPLKTTDVVSVSSSPITTEHNSSERDYVIPIVVTILTVPMLVVLVLFLYKKGAEFWERRHYRRMDFLIDGMYND